jgi:hypothetical protein
MNRASEFERDDDFYDEDDQGWPVDRKGRTWIECERCQGEGAYDQSESSPSDWGEDCCSDAPDTIYVCSECRGACGWWIKLEGQNK